MLGIVTVALELKSAMPISFSPRGDIRLAVHRFLSPNFRGELGGLPKLKPGSWMGSTERGSSRGQLKGQRWGLANI